MSIIESRCFWLSNSAFLNDRSEIQYMIRLVDDIGLDLHVSDIAGIDSELAMDARNIVLKDLDPETAQDIAQVYILSLTESSDSIALWNNYAQHEGCNVGLDMELIIKALHRLVDGRSMYAMHGAVVYKRREQEKIIHDELKMLTLKLKQASDAGAHSKIWQEFKLRMFTYAVFFKDQSFAPEKEYRVAIVGYDDDLVRFRNNKGAIVPYIEMSCNGLHEPPFCSVMIGPRNKQDIVETGLKFYLRVQGLSHVKTKSSSIPLRF